MQERIINYDFIFSYIDCKKLIYQDVSSWVSNVKPTSYIVNITFPGFDTGVDVEVFTDKANVFNAEDLLGNKNFSFTDGVYCFKYSNYGNEYIRNSANTCKLSCKLDHLIAQADLNDIKDFEQIQHIEFLLDSVKVNARFNKPEKAIEFLTKAADELSCIKCKC
jgi:hypothetical protein